MDSDPSIKKKIWEEYNLIGEVASKFEKYGFLTIPVVDEKNKMFGIVTEF